MKQYDKIGVPYMPEALPHPAFNTIKGPVIVLTLEELKEVWERGAWWMRPLPGKNPVDFETYLKSKGIKL